MIAAHIALLLDAVRLAAMSHVHLASEDRLERLLALVLQFAVNLVAVVVQLLHAKHVAVIGNGHTAHAVGHSLVYNLLHGRLSVENGVVGVNV